MSTTYTVTNDDGAMQAEIERLHAECESLRKVSAWQPIDTVPKDGTMFICWVRAEREYFMDGSASSHVHDVSQVDFCWWRLDDATPDGGYFDPACGQIGDRQDVTHWMPLPEPPQ